MKEDIKAFLEKHSPTRRKFIEVVCKVANEYFKGKPLEDKPKSVNTGLPKEQECPDCGHIVIREEGCLNCKNCGWSKCD